MSALATQSATLVGWVAFNPLGRVGGRVPSELHRGWLSRNPNGSVSEADSNFCCQNFVVTWEIHNGLILATTPEEAFKVRLTAWGDIGLGHVLNAARIDGPVHSDIVDGHNFERNTAKGHFFHRKERAFIFHNERQRERP